MSLTARPTRVGIIGAGFIGGTLARRILAGAAPGLELAFVHARDARRVEDLPASLVLREVAAFAAREPDLVVEAAHPDVSRVLGAAILGVASYLPLSTTALVDDPLRARLVAAAAAAGTRLLLPHGALAGAEALWEWRAQWASVTIRMEKHPRNIDGSAAGLDTASIAERTVLHDGPVRAIAARFPRNVNAMVTCALATVGLDATRAVLVADPALEAAVLAVDAVGRDGSELRIARRQPIAGVSGSEMAAAAWGSLVLAAGVGETLSIV